MLSTIDLIIIEGFLKANVAQFNKFCIDECVGTKGTGQTTIKHKIPMECQLHICKQKGICLLKKRPV